MIRKLWQGLIEDGLMVSIAQLCDWFGVPRRTVYYRQTKSTPRVNPELAAPITKMIDEKPSFGYRAVAWLLGMNKNTVQRIFQLKGWLVRKRRECPVFCVSLNRSMLPEGSTDDDIFQRTAGRVAEGL